MVARLRAESRLVLSGMPSTRISVPRPRSVWPKSVTVRLESAMPGISLLSMVARLLEPTFSSSISSRSSTVTWRVGLTRSLLIRSTLTSTAFSSPPSALAGGLSCFVLAPDGPVCATADAAAIACASDSSGVPAPMAATRRASGRTRQRPAGPAKVTERVAVCMVMVRPT